MVPEEWAARGNQVVREEWAVQEERVVRGIAEAPAAIASAIAVFQIAPQVETGAPSEAAAGSTARARGPVAIGDRPAWAARGAAAGAVVAEGVVVVVGAGDKGSRMGENR